MMSSRNDNIMKGFRSKALLWLSGFIGLGALWGGVVMIISPDGSAFGMTPMLIDMARLPFADILFRNFFFSGIMLILVNGVFNLLTVIGLIRKKLYGFWCGLTSGVLLFCWLGVQWIIFAVNPLTSIYTIFALIQIYLALAIIKKQKTAGY